MVSNTNPSRNAKSKKANNGMKKTVTTYSNISNRKFNKNDFKRQMDSFNDWEKKKKAKLERLKKEKEERESKLMKEPKTNKNINLKFNTNPKNFTAVERLYTQDLKKRQDKKVILAKIYTPSFQPTIYTRRENFGKYLQQNNRTEYNHRLNNSNSKRNNGIEEDEDDDDNDNNNLYESRKIKTQRYLQDDDEDSDNDYTSNNNKKNKKGRKNLSMKKKKIKIKLSNDEDEDENEDGEQSRETKIPKKVVNKNIENKLRDMLFKNRKPIKKSNSVGKRKKP